MKHGDWCICLAVLYLRVVIFPDFICLIPCRHWMTVYGKQSHTLLHHIHKTDQNDNRDEMLLQPCIMLHRDTELAHTVHHALARRTHGYLV